MRSEQRLRRRKDFAAVYRESRPHGDRLLVVRVRANDSETTRCGFAVGRVVGNAVVRNRVKRRLRAAAESIPTKRGLDIVIGARRAAADADYQELLRSLQQLLKRSSALSE